MHRWSVTTTGEFDRWFASLDGTTEGRSAQVEVIAKVELLKVCGPMLGRPHADTLKGSRHANMKELRATTGDAVLRVAFAFDPHRSAILLCAGNKAGVGEKRFYRTLLDRADSLYDAHLRSLRTTRGKKKG